MILVYVDNKDLGKVADITFERYSYRNPRYFDKPEKCDGVVIFGDWPEVRAAYDNIIELEDVTDSEGSKVIPHAQYPIKDKNSSYFTLSNGDRVNGEKNAIEAQKKLNT